MVSRLAGEHGGRAGEFQSGIYRIVFSVPFARIPARDALKAARSIGDRLNETSPFFSWKIALATDVGIMQGDVLTSAAFNRARQMLQEASAGAIEIDEKTRLALPPESAADDVSFVGREAERAVIASAFESMMEERVCRRVLVIGDPGLGKSTLVEDFVLGASDRATIVTVQCRAWGAPSSAPLAEILLALVPRLAEATESLVTGFLHDEDALVVAGQLSRLFGWGSAQDAGGVSLWSVRRMLSGLAERGPILILIEDLHWAEDIVLDALDDFVLRLESPVMMLCTARPVLLQKRPEMGTASHAANVVSLKAFDRSSSLELIESFLDGPIERGPWLDTLLEGAQGSPFFLVEALAHLRESGAIVMENRRWVSSGTSDLGSSATIEAILGARVTSLNREERDVAEAAAVWGTDFTVEELNALLPEVGGSQLLGHLAHLQSREFVEALPSGPGSMRFRLRHALIRDALYELCQKSRRATFHRRAGDFGGTAEMAEVFVGGHLEQAVLINKELGPPTDEDLALAREASRCLASAGRSERAQGAYPSAVDLFTRAKMLHNQPDGQSANTLIDLAECLRQIGQPDEVRSVIAEADSLTQDLDERSRARVELMKVREKVALETTFDPRLVKRLESLIPIFDRDDDDTGLTKIHHAIAEHHWNAGRIGPYTAAAERALEHCLRSPTKRDIHLLLSGLSAALFWGPTGTGEAITECQRLLGLAADDLLARFGVGTVLGGLKSLRGEFDEARSLVIESVSALNGMGQERVVASRTQDVAMIELLAGDPQAAHDAARRGYEELSRLGEVAYQRTNAALIGFALYELGKPLDAIGYLDYAETGEEDPTIRPMTWPVRAQIATDHGDAATARRFIDEIRLETAGSDGSIEKAYIEGPAVRVFTLLGLEREAEEALRNLEAIAGQKEAPALLRLAEARKER